MQKHLRDYFIPHKGNNRPSSLELIAVKGMLLLALLSFAITNFQSILWPTSDWLISTILPAVIVDLTNEERRVGEQVTLSRNAVLDEAAALKAADMANNQYFAHHSPNGVTPWHWFDEAGYVYAHAGENLAIHFTDSGDVVDAWMDSPTHRANIMSGNYTEIGVGTARGSYEGFPTIFVVQLFGTPAAHNAAPATIESINEVVITSENTEADVLSAQLTTADSAVEPVVTNSVTDIADIVMVEDTVAAYSDFVATTSGRAPDFGSPDNSLVTDDSSVGIAGTLTRPHFILEVLYAVIAVFVVIALLLAVFIEVKKQRPVQVAYAVLLLGVMYGLFEVHLTLTGGAIVL